MFTDARRPAEHPETKNTVAIARPICWNRMRHPFCEGVDFPSQRKLTPFLNGTTVTKQGSLKSSLFAAQQNCRAREQAFFSKQHCIHATDQKRRPRTSALPAFARTIRRLAQFHPVSESAIPGTRQTNRWKLPEDECRTHVSGHHRPVSF
jgi:hypothetical protein